ncbi:Cyanovirin-N [Penicillium sp. DV-2018c]|nr:Cyanovirin-N [Penicillium sp. DV-2018c]KAJ5567075.1 Cyanovirin-N [Penicillium sp. DV-2018c]
MSFNKTSCNIHLSAEGDGTHLAAICNNDEGSGLTTEVLLDKYLGNKDGHFEWGGTNFSKSARNITCRTEGPDRKPILRCELRNSSGEYVPDKTDLTDHIANVEGELQYAQPED